METKLQALFIYHDLDEAPIKARDLEGEVVHGDKMWEKATAFVGTSMVEFVNVWYAGDRAIMLVDDLGQSKGLPLNTFATGLYWAATMKRHFDNRPIKMLPMLSPILGRAVLFPPGAMT